MAGDPARPAVSSVQKPRYTKFTSSTHDSNLRALASRDASPFASVKQVAGRNDGNGYRLHGGDVGRTSLSDLDLLDTLSDPALLPALETQAVLVDTIHWSKVPALIEQAKEEGANADSLHMMLVYADAADMALEDGRFNRQKILVSEGASDESEPDIASEHLNEREVLAQLRDWRRGSHGSKTAVAAMHKDCPLRSFAVPVCLRFDASGAPCRLHDRRQDGVKNGRRRYKDRSSKDDANKFYRALYRPNKPLPARTTRAAVQSAAKADDNAVTTVDAFVNRDMDVRISQNNADIYVRHLNHVLAVRAFVKKGWDGDVTLARVRAVGKQYDWQVREDIVEKLASSESRDAAVDSMLLQHLLSTHGSEETDVRRWTAEDARAEYGDIMKPAQEERVLAATVPQMLNRAAGRALAAMKGQDDKDVRAVAKTDDWKTLSEAIRISAQRMYVALQARQCRPTVVTLVVDDSDRLLATWGFPVSDTVAQAATDAIRSHAMAYKTNAIREDHTHAPIALGVMLEEHGADAAVDKPRALRAKARSAPHMHLRVFQALCTGRPRGCHGIDMELSWLAGSVLLDTFGDALQRAGAVTARERRAWALPPRAQVAFRPSWDGWVARVRENMGNDGKDVEHLVRAWKTVRRRGGTAVPSDAELSTIVLEVGLKLAESLRPVVDAGLDWLYGHVAVPSDGVTMCVDAAIAINSAVPTLAANANQLLTDSVDGGEQYQLAAQNLLDEMVLSSEGANSHLRHQRVGGGTLGEPSYALARASVSVTRVLHDLRVPCSVLRKPLALTRACGAATAETVPPGSRADTVLKLMELSAGARGTEPDGACNADAPVSEYSDLHMALASRFVAVTWASLSPATRAKLQQHRLSETGTETWPDGARPFVDAMQLYAQMFENASDRRILVPRGIGTPGRPVAPSVAALYHGANIVVYAPDVRVNADGVVTVTLDAPARQ